MIQHLATNKHVRDSKTTPPWAQYPSCTKNCAHYLPSGAVSHCHGHSQYTMSSSCETPNLYDRSPCVFDMSKADRDLLPKVEYERHPLKVLAHHTDDTHQAPPDIYSIASIGRWSQKITLTTSGTTFTITSAPCSASYLESNVWSTQKLAIPQQCPHHHRQGLPGDELFFAIRSLFVHKNRSASEASKKSWAPTIIKHENSADTTRIVLTMIMSTRSVHLSRLTYIGNRKAPRRGKKE